MSTSRGSQHVEAEDVTLSELSREWDAQKYYQSWLHSATVETSADEDVTLTAFAQLAALRLNAKHATVSLIHGETLTIIAEASRIAPLVDRSRIAPQKSSPVPRASVIDEHVIGARSVLKDADGQDRTISALLLADASIDDRFKHYPDVSAQPGIRFYAGVPIVSKQGRIIGAFGVSDDQPHPDRLLLSDVLFLHDIANAAFGYLERILRCMEIECNEAFVRGMNRFIKDVANIRIDSASMTSEESRATSQEREDHVQATDPHQDDAKATEDFSDVLSEAQGDDTESPSIERVLPSRESTSDRLPKFSRESCGQGNDGAGSAASNIKQIHQKAASFLREVTRAEGCIILDASSGLFANTPDGQAFYSAVGRTTSGFETDIEDDDMDELEKSSLILGAAFSDDVPETLRTNALKRRHFKTCLEHYPSGQYFCVEDGKVVSSQPGLNDTGSDNHLRSTEQEMGDTGSPQPINRSYLPRKLLEQLTGRKWLVFIPLLNHTQDQWAAGLFIWSNDGSFWGPGKIVPYLKTFSSCLVSEVASMEAYNTSISKSTFIASISHDLRSPLHGMLGSLEFLEDTITTAYQTSLVGSIETCGRTLLDTIDHLLDYAKINSSNQDKTLEDPSTANGEASPGPPLQADDDVFDLGLVLEEVVEAVFAGQTFRKTQLRGRDQVDETISKIEAIGLDDYASTEDQIHAGSAKFSGKVFFILDIHKAKTWCMKGPTGGLRRVIMNVVGNAIKYCNHGTIEIVLSTKARDDSQADVEIIVKDSGIGMSQKYLETDLFKPFSQEDTFSPGAGLGLSVTSQIVGSMNGKILIQSEKGLGTHATISLPMQIADPSAIEPERVLQAVGSLAKGREICLLNPSLSRNNDMNNQLSKLTVSIARTCEEWFNMKCYQADKIVDDQDVSIYVYCEPPPIEYLLQHHTERRLSGKTGKDSALLIICTNAFEAAALRSAGVSQLTNLGRVVEVVSQPIGVRKLAKTILQCLQRIDQIAGVQRKPSSTPVMYQMFATGEASQRANEVEWNTASTVYDSTLERHRPAIDRYQWKSNEIKTNRKLDLAEPEQSQKLGLLQANDLPKPPAVETNGVASEQLPHVLVVDDNAINLKLLVNFMKKIKLPYAEAVNGLEAFTKFKESDKPFDYVLMDLQMPIMDGLEATRRIREYERTQKTSKASNIIAITGVGNDSTRKEAFDAGMTQYLTKPVRFKALQQMLEKDIQS